MRLLLLLLALCGSAHADDSLYRALGAKEGIRALMDDFVPRLQADARIGHFFQGTNARHLASQLADQICQVSGGPCEYQGPDMKTTHEAMEVRRADFNALVEQLQAAMRARGIPFADQNRLLARLAPMHRDIVTR